MTVPKIVTLKNIIILGLIIFILYLAYCNRPVAPGEKPQVIPVTTQREVVRTDSIASQIFKDSVNKIIDKWKWEANHWENNWNREVEDNAALQKTVSDVLNESVPDTCESYKKKALAEFSKLSISSAKKDTACSKALSSLKNIIGQKDVLITQGKKDYSLLKKHFDTALIQQSILTKQLPKREVVGGISMLTSYNIFKPQIGLVLGYRNKKGIELNIAVYTNQQVTATLKKPLFRF